MAHRNAAVSNAPVPNQAARVPACMPAWSSCHLLTKPHSGGIPLTLILVFVIYVGTEIVNGLTSADNISHLSHIIGGVCGAVLGVGLRSGRK